MIFLIDYWEQINQSNKPLFSITNQVAQFTLDLKCGQYVSVIVKPCSLIRTYLSNLNPLCTQVL